MQAQARVRLFRPGARTVQAPIAQHHALHRRRQHRAFQRGDSVDAAPRTLGAQVQRLLLAVRQRSRCVGPGDALRHQTLGAGGLGGSDQIGGALARRRRVALDGRAHARRVEPGGRSVSWCITHCGRKASKACRNASASNTSSTCASAPAARKAAARSALRLTASTR
jgi:hypothetical protein